jgi:hypothetical protein
MVLLYSNTSLVYNSSDLRNNSLDEYMHYLSDFCSSFRSSRSPIAPNAVSDMQCFPSLQRDIEVAQMFRVSTHMKNNCAMYEYPAKK